MATELWVNIGSGNGLVLSGITWTNVDLSLVRSSDIDLMAISQGAPQPSITKIRLKITYLKFLSNLPGANELDHGAREFEFIPQKILNLITYLCPNSMLVKGGPYEYEIQIDIKLGTEENNSLWNLPLTPGNGVKLRPIQCLTHWGRDKMAVIFQTTFSNGFSWMKMYEFRLTFHWSLFLRVQLTIFQYWFR